MTNDFENLIADLKNKMNTVDDKDVIEKYKKLEYDNLLNKIEFIKKTTPKKYWRACLVKNFPESMPISKKFMDFFNSDKAICWITGKYGSGKTHHIYAKRNYEIIYKANIYYNVKMENELNYDANFKQIDAVDNVVIEASKIKFLSQFYFDLIDYCWKNEKKLCLTSIHLPEKWLESFFELKAENAGAIADRMKKNNYELIELEGESLR